MRKCKILQQEEFLISFCYIDNLLLWVLKGNTEDFLRIIFVTRVLEYIYCKRMSSLCTSKTFIQFNLYPSKVYQSTTEVIEKPEEVLWETEKEGQPTSVVDRHWLRFNLFPSTELLFSFVKVIRRHLFGTF